MVSIRKSILLKHLTDVYVQKSVDLLASIKCDIDLSKIEDLKRLHDIIQSLDNDEYPENMHFGSMLAFYNIETMRGIRRQMKESTAIQTSQRHGDVNAYQE